jgi:hypothetical protein
MYGEWCSNRITGRPHDLFLGCGKKIAHRLMCRGIAKVRRQVHQRRQNETPRGISRVGNLQERRIDHAISIEDDIDIDRARAVENRAAPFELPLDRLSARQQLSGEKECVRFHRDVKEPRLPFEALRLGFINL